MKARPDGVNFSGGDVSKPRDAGRAAVDESLMDKRVRSVQNVETVDIAHRVEKAFQAVVAAGAILNADDILVAASWRAVSGAIVFPVRAGML